MLLPMLMLPLVTSFLVGVVGRRIGISGTNILVIGTLAICTLLSLTLSYEIIFTGTSVSIEPLMWLDTGHSLFTWGFNISPLNAWLISTVLTISFMVHIFASSYMAGDPNPQKFMALLLAFTGFMVLLIAGDNLGVLFFGYEGIGITSYLLIGYWFDRAAACNGAGQAIIVNRIGDTFFTIVLITLLSLWSSSLDLHNLNYTFTSASSNSLDTVIKFTGVLLVLAAAGKSAQFLLHTWLPNAMEGPTPVSSLLHAATLVMGGVYLLLSTTSILGASSAALIFAAILGTITALFAASTALVQNDIKRVIAYSTCSQFGYLFASIGLSQTMSTVLHLSSHAGFKALLFICAGGVIHSMKDEQDIRRLGGTITLLPFTYACMLIASLSLMAMPYLSGNASKDLILELAAVHISIPGTFMWILGSIIAGITACYSVRLLALTFFGQPTAPKTFYQDIHEQPAPVVIPMVFLTIISIFFGYFAKEPLAGLGSDSIVHQNYYSSFFAMNYLVEAEYSLSLISKNLPVLCTFAGTFAGIILFIILPSTNTNIKSTYNYAFYSFLSNKWGIDSVQARIFSWPYFYLGLFCSKIIDRGLFELFGPAGLTFKANQIFNSLISSNYPSLPLNTNLNISKLNTVSTSPENNVPEYALYIGLLAFVSVLVLFSGLI